MLKDRLFEYHPDFDIELPAKLSRIWAKIDVEKLLKPINYDELKECFIQSKGFFNPEFKYDEEKITACYENLKIIAHGLSSVLVNINTLESNEDQTRAEFVRHLVSVRLNEALSIKKFLREILDGCPERSITDLMRIYDLPDQRVVKFAKEIAARGWRDEYDDAEFYTVIETPLMRKRMQKEFYSANTVAQMLRTALLHLLKEPIMCRYFNSEGGFNTKVGDYEKIGTVFENGKMVIGVPEDTFISGEDLLAVIGREVDGHFRTLAVTQMFIAMMLGKNSPLAPLALVLAKSMNDSCYNSYARSAYIDVKGSAGLPEPFVTLAVSYARHKHNFAETAEYVYNYCLKYGLEKAEAREKTWEVTTQAFLGQSNTRKLVGYAFLKNCGEIEGFLRAGNMTEDEYYYLRNLAALETGELQCAIVGGWLDDDDFVDEIDCSIDVIEYMVDFF